MNLFVFWNKEKLREFYAIKMRTLNLIVFHILWKKGTESILKPDYVKGICSSFFLLMFFGMLVSCFFFPVKWLLLIPL